MDGGIHPKGSMDVKSGIHQSSPMGVRGQQRPRYGWRKVAMSVARANDHGRGRLAGKGKRSGEICMTRHVRVARVLLLADRCEVCV